MLNTVRLALPAEAIDVARIQRRAWSENPRLAGMPQQVGADQAAQIWHQAITRPPLATMRVLVAIGEAGVVGFAVTSPSDDPDADAVTGEISEFVVERDSRRSGHGSRLLNAAVDTLRTDGFRLATIWVPATSDGFRAFLENSGWAADGAHQEVGADEEEEAGLKLVRLHTDISGATEGS